MASTIQTEQPQASWDKQARNIFVILLVCSCWNNSPLSCTSGGGSCSSWKADYDGLRWAPDFPTETQHSKTGAKRQHFNASCLLSLGIAVTPKDLSLF